MDGDRDRDPHWSTGLSSLGPNEEQKEGEREQESHDHKGCFHLLTKAILTGSDGACDQNVHSERG